MFNHSSPEKFSSIVKAETVSQTLMSLDINEFAPRFEAYMTRIENGRVNEPLTILETDHFPTHYFCSATKGWTGFLGDGPQALFDQCNIEGYELGGGDDCKGCVQLLQSSYRYLQVGN